MKKLIIIIATCISLIALFVLNPDTAQHKQKVLTEYKPVIMESIKGENNLANILVGSLFSNAIDEKITNEITADNYYLFSLTKVKENGKIIGIGILGKVFLFLSEDDVARNMENKTTQKS